MASTTVFLGSIAASATATVTIPVAEMTGYITARLSATGATVSATNGLKVSFQVSKDGSTFVASNQPGYTLPLVANTIVTQQSATPVSYSWDRWDGGVLEAIKVSIQNLDTTNAVTAHLEYDNEFNVGR